MGRIKLIKEFVMFCKPNIKVDVSFPNAHYYVSSNVYGHVMSHTTKAVALLISGTRKVYDLIQTWLNLAHLLRNSQVSHYLFFQKKKVFTRNLR